MFSSYRIRRHTERGRTQHPVRIGQVVDESKIFETPVRAVKPVVFGIFNTEPQIFARIGAPACRSNQQAFEQAAFPFLRLQKDGRIKQARSCFVIEIALILVQVANNLQTAITDFKTRDNCVVAGVVAGINCR